MEQDPHHPRMAEVFVTSPTVVCRCRCVMIKHKNEEGMNVLMCTNSDCGNYLKEWEYPAVILKAVEKSGAGARPGKGVTEQPRPYAIEDRSAVVHTVKFLASERDTIVELLRLNGYAEIDPVDFHRLAYDKYEPAHAEINAAVARLRHDGEYRPQSHCATDGPDGCA